MIKEEQNLPCDAQYSFFKKQNKRPVPTLYLLFLFFFPFGSYENLLSPARSRRCQPVHLSPATGVWRPGHPADVHAFRKRGLSQSLYRQTDKPQQVLWYVVRVKMKTKYLLVFLVIFEHLVDCPLSCVMLQGMQVSQTNPCTTQV